MNIASSLQDCLSKESFSLVQMVKAIGEKNNSRIVLVGGLVRDVVLKKSVYDLDFMVDPPAGIVAGQLAEALKGKLISHERFYTFSVQYGTGEKIDVVTARTETYSSPARLPDVTPSTIEEDLSRRDFSINAMAVWVSGGTFGHVLDPYNGNLDIQSKKIRFLHENSFVDDPTRIFRAARFAGRFGFDLESRTREGISQCDRESVVSLLSPVRLRHELELILKEENPLPALEILQEWNMLPYFSPSWTLMDAHRSFFSGEGTGLFLDRLYAWLKPFGRDQAREALGGLQFERKVKTEILLKFDN